MREDKNSFEEIRHSRSTEKGNVVIILRYPIHTPGTYKMFSEPIIKILKFLPFEETKAEFSFIITNQEKRHCQPDWDNKKIN